MPAVVVKLLDGTTATLRGVASNDTTLVRDLFQRVSSRSRYLRFHHAVKEIPPAELLHYTEVDGSNRFGLVVTVQTELGERAVGMGHYFRTGPDVAEVAFLVDDEHQHLGIGTHILSRLIEVARNCGIETFEADFLGENRLMMEVFQACGYPVCSVLKYGEIHVTVPIGESSNASKSS